MALPSTQTASQFIAHLNEHLLFELIFCRLLTFVKFQTFMNLINQCFTRRCFELRQIIFWEWQVKSTLSSVYCTCHYLANYVFYKISLIVSNCPPLKHWLQVMDVFSDSIIAWFCWNNSMKFLHFRSFIGCRGSQATKLGLLHILVSMQNHISVNF